MKDYEIAGLQAKEVTASFIMTINGIFFVTRKAGQTPRPQDIERAKGQIQIASYIYINNLKEVVNKYNDESRQPQVILDELMSITSQMIRSANKAVRHGVQSRAATLIGASAHGAQGELIQHKLREVDLSVSYHGRTWRRPDFLISAIVQKYVRGVE